MGHDFYIGERTAEEVFYDGERSEYPSVVDMDGCEMGSPDATKPWHRESLPNGDYRNHIAVGYTRFFHFCRNVGLDMEHVIGGWPGYISLTPAHLNGWISAQGRYQRSGQQDDDYDRLFDFFIFWIRWALEECDDPVILNT